MTLKTILFGATSALVLSAGAANAVPATAETSLNVRSGPGTQYEVVGTIPGGETVDARDCSGSWCRVRFPGGTGFASRSYLAMGGGGPAVAVAPGYVYGDGPYYDDYYGYGYGYGPSVGFYFGGRDRFHHRWDRGRIGTWSGGHRWNGGNWSGNRTGIAEGGRGFQGGQVGRNFQGGNIGGRASANASAGMPSGGSFRGGGGAMGGGAPASAAAPTGGGHVGGTVGGAGGAVARH